MRSVLEFLLPIVWRVRLLEFFVYRDHSVLQCNYRYGCEFCQFRSDEPDAGLPASSWGRI